MTIPQTTRLVSYEGDDVTSVFSFPWLLYDETQLLVWVEESDGSYTEFVLNDTGGTDGYTVQNVGVQAGGTITLYRSGVPQALESNRTLTIETQVPYKQPTSFRSQGTFYPKTHEETFDKIVHLIQQALEQQELPEYTTATRPGANEYWNTKLIVVKDIGVTSNVQRCLKKADNTYEWVIVEWGAV